MLTNGVSKNKATEFCNCMFTKISQKYTPEEAVNISEEAETNLWHSCGYYW